MNRTPVRRGRSPVKKRAPKFAEFDHSLDQEMRGHVRTLLDSLPEQVSEADLTRAIANRRPNAIPIRLPSVPPVLPDTLARQVRSAGVREARRSTKGVKKYSDDEPRDESGKWTSGGGGGSAAPISLGATKAGAKDPTGAKADKLFAIVGVDLSGNLVGDTNLKAENVARIGTALGQQAESNPDLKAQLDEIGANVLADPNLYEKVSDTGEPSPYAMTLAERLGIQSGTPAESMTRAEVGGRFVAMRLQDSWANTCGDSDLTALALQSGVAEQFGTGMGTLDWQEPLEGSEDAAKTWGTSVSGPEELGSSPAVQAYISQVYSDTQAALADAGIKEVGLYRGVGWDRVPEVPKEWRQIGEDPTATTADLHPLSSFSIDYGQGVRFADTFQASGFGATQQYLIETTAPASRIFSFPSTGPGADEEGEVVVIGGEDNAVDVHAIESRYLEQQYKAAPGRVNLDEELHNADWLKAVHQAKIAKYSDDQPRDDHGRFASTGGGGGSSAPPGTSHLTPLQQRALAQLQAPTTTVPTATSQFHVAANVLGAEDFRSATDTAALRDSKTGAMIEVTGEQGAEYAERFGESAEALHDQMATEIFHDKGDWNGTINTGSLSETRSGALASYSAEDHAIDLPQQMVIQGAAIEQVLEENPEYGKQLQSLSESVTVHELVHSFANEDDIGQVSHETFDASRGIEEGAANRVAAIFMESHGMDDSALQTNAYGGWAAGLQSIEPDSTEGKYSLYRDMMSHDITSMARGYTAPDGSQVKYTPEDQLLQVTDPNGDTRYYTESEPKAYSSRIAANDAQVYGDLGKAQMFSPEARAALAAILRHDPAPAEAFIASKPWDNVEAWKVRAALSDYVPPERFAKYSEDQERDDHGRFAGDGGGGGGGEPASAFKIGDKVEWDTQIGVRRGEVVRVNRKSVQVETEHGGRSTVEPEILRRVVGKYSDDEPRDERGRWTSGGGGGEAPPGAEHESNLLPGSSALNPVITKSVDEAAIALSRGQYVDLEQERGLSTLMDKLAEMGQQAKEAGEKAPVIDLAKVTIQGSNLFLNGNLGIPRIDMPQLSGEPLPGSPADALPRIPDPSGGPPRYVDITQGFIQHLADEGISVSDQEVPAQNLRATQSEIDGVKVAQQVQGMESGAIDTQSREIWTTSDDYVLDGHHWWAAIAAVSYEEGKTLDVKTHVIDAPITQVLQDARAYANQMGIPQRAVGKIRRAFAKAWAAFKSFGDPGNTQQQDEHGHFTAGSGGGGGGAGATTRTLPGNEPVRIADLPEKAQSGVEKWIEKNNIDTDAMAAHIYSTLTSEEARAAGASWYRDEFQAKAEALAEKYDRPVDEVTAVIAITSAQEPWSVVDPNTGDLKYPNLETAERFLQAAQDGAFDGATTLQERIDAQNGLGYMRDNGFGANVVGLLNGTLSVDEAVTGTKRRSFFDDGMDPDHATEVTNDVWMGQFMAAHSDLADTQIQGMLSGTPPKYMADAGYMATPAYVTLSDSVIAATDRARAEGIVPPDWTNAQTQATAWVYLAQNRGEVSGHGARIAKAGLVMHLDAYGGPPDAGATDDPDELDARAIRQQMFTGPIRSARYPTYEWASQNPVALQRAGVVKYSDDQPRDDHGRWTDGGGGGTGQGVGALTVETIDLATAVTDITGGPVPEAPHSAQAAALADQAEAGGFSVSPFTGTGPTSGYMVAGIEEPTVVPVADEHAVAAAIETFLDKHADMDPNLFVGGWVSDGNLYLEPAENVATRAEAVAVGAERNQIAIWDVVNFAEIQTGGTGEFTGAGAAEVGRPRDIEKARVLQGPDGLEAPFPGRAEVLLALVGAADHRRGQAEVLNGRSSVPRGTTELTFAKADTPEAEHPGLAILRFRFNLDDPKAIEWAREHAGNLIRDLTDSTRQTIQALVSAAVNAAPGMPPYALAQQIRPLIGLTPRYATAVLNYSIRMQEAGNPNWSQLTQAYYDKLLTSRATTIARTEILAAANEGKLEAWQQGMVEGLFGEQIPLKEWIAAPDAEEACAALDGTMIPLVEMFTDPTGKFDDTDNPPLHPNCRCTMAIGGYAPVGVSA